MRKFLPFLFAAALASSCIDNAYDLSNVNTDDVTIGDEDSEYRLPLATVYVSMSELNEGGADIKTLFDEADIWLPSPLPGNAAYVDLRELQNTPETITPLLDALIDQMMDDDAKITAVADLLAEKYLSTFLPLLPPNTDPADFKPVFIEAFRNMPMLHDRLSGEVKSLAGSYLTELKVQDVTYDIGKIDIGGDVVDMLCENLDSEGTPTPKHAAPLRQHHERPAREPAARALFLAYERPVRRNGRTRHNERDQGDATFRKRPAADHRGCRNHPPRLAGEILSGLRFHVRSANHHHPAPDQARRPEAQPLIRHRT